MPPPEEPDIRFPNPDSLKIHFRQMEHGGQIGDLWEAARAARVQPKTILQWIRRRKIEPVLTGDGGMVFHLPTIAKASRARPGRPRKSAA